MQVKRAATVRVVEFTDGQFAWFYEIDGVDMADMSQPVDAAVMDIMGFLGKLFADEPAEQH